MPVKVKEFPLEATIDTSGEVTIISDLALRSSMLVGPVYLQLEATIYKELIHVTPIVNNMLLGLEFLTKHSFVKDAAIRQLKHDDDVLEMKCRKRYAC